MTHASLASVSPSQLSRWRWVAVAMVLSLRLFYAFAYADQPSDTNPRSVGGDAADFLQIAWTLKETGHYGTPIVGEQRLDVLSPLLRGEPMDLPANTSVAPSGWRPPLWTAALALFLALSGGSLTGALLMRFALDAATVLLFARLIERAALPRWAALLALGLLALHPTWLIYSNTWLSEPLSLLLLVALANTTLHARDQLSTRSALAVGAIAGLAVLCHPLFLFAAIGSVVYSTFPHGAHRRRDRSYGPLLVASLCFVLLVGAWVLRNATALDEVTITTSSKHVLAMSWSEDFLDVYNNATAEVLLPEGPGPMEFLEEHWASAPLIAARKVVGALGPMVETRRAGILEFGRAAWWSLAFIPVWLCLVFRGFLPGPLHSVVRIQLGGYLLMTVLTYPSIRFRAPLAHLDVIAVVAVLAWLTQRFTDRQPNRDLIKN